MKGIRDHDARHRLEAHKWEFWKSGLNRGCTLRSASLSVSDGELTRASRSPQLSLCSIRQLLRIMAFLPSRHIRAETQKGRFLRALAGLLQIFVRRVSLSRIPTAPVKCRPRIMLLRSLEDGESAWRLETVGSHASEAGHPFLGTSILSTQARGLVILSLR